MITPCIAKIHLGATTETMELNMDIELCFSPFKGSVYFPSRSYNAYQTFKYYDSEETYRDFPMLKMQD